MDVRCIVDDFRLERCVLPLSRCISFYFVKPIRSWFARAVSRLRLQRESTNEWNELRIVCVIVVQRAVAAARVYECDARERLN